jgi:hypothetical protein
MAIEQILLNKEQKSGSCRSFSLTIAYIDALAALSTTPSALTTTPMAYVQPPIAPGSGGCRSYPITFLLQIQGYTQVLSRLRQVETGAQNLGKAAKDIGTGTSVAAASVNALGTRMGALSTALNGAVSSARETNAALTSQVESLVIQW